LGHFYGLGQQLNVASTAISVNGDLDPLEKMIDPEQHKGQSSI